MDLTELIIEYEDLRMKISNELDYNISKELLQRQDNIRDQLIELLELLNIII